MLPNDITSCFVCMCVSMYVHMYLQTESSVDVSETCVVYGSVYPSCLFVGTYCGREGETLSGSFRTEHDNSSCWDGSSCVHVLVLRLCVRNHALDNAHYGNTISIHSYCNTACREFSANGFGLNLVVYLPSSSSLCGCIALHCIRRRWTEAST